MNPLFLHIVAELHVYAFDLWPSILSVISHFMVFTHSYFNCLNNIPYHYSHFPFRGRPNLHIPVFAIGNSSSCVNKAMVIWLSSHRYIFHTFYVQKEKFRNTKPGIVFMIQEYTFLIQHLRSTSQTRDQQNVFCLSFQALVFTMT
jgi:hypothetical protein